MDRIVFRATEPLCATNPAALAAEPYLMYLF